jgi:hypothetical protein
MITSLVNKFMMDQIKPSYIHQCSKFIFKSIHCLILFLMIIHFFSLTPTIKRSSYRSTAAQRSTTRPATAYHAHAMSTRPSSGPLCAAPPPPPPPRTPASGNIRRYIVAEEQARGPARRRRRRGSARTASATAARTSRLSTPYRTRAGPPGKAPPRLCARGGSGSCSGACQAASSSP